MSLVEGFVQPLLQVQVVNAEAYAYDEEVIKKAEAMGFPGLVSISAREDSFIFTVEATGALKPAAMVLNALDVLRVKLDGVRSGLAEATQEDQPMLDYPMNGG
jgi:DNA-directed RNA polymerase II subunit RPB3